MRFKKLFFAFLLIPALLAGCSGPQWGQYATPTFNIATSTPAPTATLIPVPVTATAQPSPTETYLPPTLENPPTPTPLPTLEGTPVPPVLYYTQSGDTLSTVAIRFGVDPSQITSPDSLPEYGTLLDSGILLVVPNVLGETTPAAQIMPDSEVVYSATALDFNTVDFVANTNGYLNDYIEYLKSTSNTSGARIVERVALENSINPRLLLALLEYQSGWVTGQPNNIASTDYPFGYTDFNARGLYAQLVRTVDDLSVGYYDYRAGKLTELTFPDGQTIRLAPTLNAGSVAIQYFFAQHLNYDEWAKAIDPNIGMPALYTDLFGSPWERDSVIAPLYPPGLTQPALALPFVPNITWSFTGGPHPAWEHKGAMAALDFAPPADKPGCETSSQWVTAPAPGLVVRSGNGIVILDLDGDGKEQTGWNILFLHIADAGRVKTGTWLDLGDHVGHPSCEGGIATGKHVHIARKFNGEWIIADSPLPFNLDGWVAHNGKRPYLGTMTKGDQVIEACTCGSYWTHVKREVTP